MGTAVSVCVSASRLLKGIFVCVCVRLCANNCIIIEAVSSFLGSEVTRKSAVNPALTVGRTTFSLQHVE